jgi:dTDP-4-dehydrorhamnose 3,5-epimerase
MIFHETSIPGAWLIDPERKEDERGFFARVWSREEFAARGLETAIDQCSVSFNHQRGTLRGMHYQAPPHGEVKLVRCTAGAIYDVIVDLRDGSPTRLKWEAFELTALNRHALYIPKGLGHGFITLADDTEIYYQIAPAQHAESARGARWNDAAFGIGWPMPPRVISPRDASYPDFLTEPA